MLKIFTKLDYLLKETLLGLRRGSWMNWAAICTVAVLLFLFGLSLQTSWQLEHLLDRFGSQLEISVYLDSEANSATLQSSVTQIPGVTKVEKVTKEEAWQKLVGELGIADIGAATEQLGSNPLVDELRIKVGRPENVPNLAMELAKLQGVDSVQYVDEAVKKIGQLHKGLNWFTVWVTAILTVTAIAVTSITIRLIVLARRREIEVMQLVGATFTWIYFPFIVQGITFGLLGGAIAWALINLSQRFLQQLLTNQPEFIRFISSGLTLSLTQTILLPAILLGFGSIVGLLGSLFAVRKFAKV